MRKARKVGRGIISRGQVSIRRQIRRICKCHSGQNTVHLDFEKYLSYKNILNSIFVLCAHGKKIDFFFL